MTYVEGFVTAVPTANEEAYRAHAAQAAALLLELGATRLVEAWGDDVPRGKVNDLWGAVAAGEDETVVFSWLEYPDKAVRDAASERIMQDPRMEAMAASMPFDGARMIYGGFAALVDTGGSRAPGYVDGIVLPVSPDKREPYAELARKAADVFADHGATRYVEGWGDDVPHGKRTDFFRASHARGDEVPVFSFIEWPDKDARTRGWDAVMADERMMSAHADAPFDGTRMTWGGFRILLDTGAGA